MRDRVLNDDLGFARDISAEDKAEVHVVPSHFRSQTPLTERALIDSPRGT